MGTLFALPSNIRLGKKWQPFTNIGLHSKGRHGPRLRSWMAVTNTLAYCSMELIAAVVRFMVHAPGCHFHWEKWLLGSQQKTFKKLQRYLFDRSRAGSASFGRKPLGRKTFGRQSIETGWSTNRLIVCRPDDRVIVKSNFVSKKCLPNALQPNASRPNAFSATWLLVKCLKAKCFWTNACQWKCL